MDGRGRWMDNVFIERVWRSLKYEDVYLKGYADGREAKAGISDWIIFYNERRLHQALGYRVPMAVWREGAPPKAYGHVDNANALTTCPRHIRISSRQNLGGLIKGNQQTTSNLAAAKNGPLRGHQSAASADRNPHINTNVATLRTKSWYR